MFTMVDLVSAFTKAKINVALKIAEPKVYRLLSRTFKRLAVVVTLILALAILFLALAPPNITTNGGINDKVLHFTTFAILVLPCAVFLARHLVWIVIGALLFGGIIEVLQPGFAREASWADFQADLTGVVAGVVVGLILRFAIKRFLSKHFYQQLV